MRRLSISKAWSQRPRARSSSREPPVPEPAMSPIPPATTTKPTSQSHSTSGASLSVPARAHGALDYADERVMVGLVAVRAELAPVRGEQRRQTDTLGQRELRLTEHELTDEPLRLS